jgi:uncharacterized protein (DUF433 family)
MSKTEYRIVSGEDSEIHDEPHIEGRRLTVRTVHARVDGGLSPGTVAEQHAVDIAEVYQALAYYHDNPEEMADVERRRQATIETHDDDLVAPAEFEA